MPDQLQRNSSAFILLFKPNLGLVQSRSKKWYECTHIISYIYVILDLSENYLSLSCHEFLSKCNINQYFVGHVVLLFLHSISVCFFKVFFFQTGTIV